MNVFGGSLLESECPSDCIQNIILQTPLTVLLLLYWNSILYFMHLSFEMLWVMMS